MLRKSADWERQFQRRFVQRAIETDAPLLAVALHRYIEAEGLTWEQLARELGCTTDDLDAVAMCRPPRREYFSNDVRSIADRFVDPKRLLPLLRRLQVLEAFGQDGATAAESHEAANLLLAARDRNGDLSEAADAQRQPTDPPDNVTSPDSETGNSK
jgi:hypothetical protein